MADVKKVIILDDGTATNLIDDNTKLSVNYKPVTLDYNGSLMTDAIVDGNFYIKSAENIYYKKVIDKEGELFLEKDTMNQLRNITSYELILIKSGVVKGVKLNGYYEKNDTPSPIEYYLSNTVDPDDGGSIIETKGIKLEHKFADRIYTSYFGLSDISGKTPIENKLIIQNTFNASNKYNCKKVYISKGIIEISGGGINYDTEQSEVTFLGELKLANNSNSGEVQFIRYRASNVYVFNQRYDGNRNNNTFSTNAGTQCNFATYGVENVTFIGGYSKNSLQSHIHSTAENLVIEHMLFDTAGEHGLYLTLGVDQPKDKVTLRDCVIRNWGVGHAGAGLSCRDYRNALFERCTWDPTNSVKPASVPIIGNYYNYRSDLPMDTPLKHIFKDCIFKSGTNVTNGIRCLTDPEKPYTQEEFMNKGSGIYIEGGVLEYPAVEGVVSMRNVTIRPNGSALAFNKLPRNLLNCVLENVLYCRPQSPLVCNIEGNEFRDTDAGVVTTGIMFDFNSGVLTGGNWNFKNNTFVNFKNSTTNGIIRNTTDNNNLIIEGNKLKDCVNAVLIYSGASVSNTILSNSDVSKSGVRLRFTPTAVPRLVSNNDFVQVRGTTGQRPTGTTVYTGMVYDNTTTGQVEEYNGTAWGSKLPIATTSVSGMVKQTALIADPAINTIPSQASQSVATTIDQLKIDLNNLATLFNQLRLYSAENRTKIIEKLTKDKASGQQISP